MLVFRGQTFSQEDLVRVTAYFGEIGPLARPAKLYPKGFAKLLPNIMLMSVIVWGPVVTAWNVSFT